MISGQWQAALFFLRLGFRSICQRASGHEHFHSGATGCDEDRLQFWLTTTVLQAEQTLAQTGKSSWERSRQLNLAGQAYRDS